MAGGRQDPIFERLVREGLIADVSEVDVIARHRSMSIASQCWVLGLVDETSLAGIIGDHHARQAVVLERSVFSLEPLLRMRALELRDELLMPVAEDADAVHVVVDRPDRVAAEIDAIGRLFGKPVVVRVALAVTLGRTLRTCLAMLARGERMFVGAAALPGRLNLCVVEPRALTPSVVGEVTQAMVLDDLMDLDITAETELDDGKQLAEAFAYGIRRVGRTRRHATRVSDPGSTDDDRPSTYTAQSQVGGIGEETSQVVLELDASAGPHYGRGHGGKARVVVVDDDLAARQLVVRELAEQGYEIIEVKNARDAIGVIREVPPDLVISDVMLPDMGGFQLCRAIKESRKYAGIAVVLVSAVIDSERVDDGVLALYGLDAYFEKPLGERFKRRVRELLVERGAATSVSADAFDRALAMYRAGKLDEAVVALGQAIAAEPQSVRYQLFLANLYYKLGRPEAIEAYETVLTLRPDYFPALNRLGYLYHKAGLPTKAIESWSRALPVCPDPRVREIIAGVVEKITLALART